MTWNGILAALDAYLDELEALPFEPADLDDHCQDLAGRAHRLQVAVRRRTRELRQ